MFNGCQEYYDDIGAPRPGGICGMRRQCAAVSESFLVPPGQARLFTDVYDRRSDLGVGQAEAPGSCLSDLFVPLDSIVFFRGAFDIAKSGTVKVTNRPTGKGDYRSSCDQKIGDQ